MMDSTTNKCASVLVVGLLMLAARDGRADLPWMDEEWIVEPFTSALGGGPGTGPSIESGRSVDSLCGDEEGNLYLAHEQMIDIITPDGIRRHLAGTGEPGFRDGPASQARFRL